MKRFALLLIALLLPALAMPIAYANPSAITTWETVNNPSIPGLTVSFASVTTPSPSQAFAVGAQFTDSPTGVSWRSLIERWDGSSWKRMAAPDAKPGQLGTRLNGVDGTSPTDVWAVGSTFGGPANAVPYAIHFNGRRWTSVPVPDPSGGETALINAVTMVTATNVWAVGTSLPSPAQGAIFHYNGTRWSAQKIPAPAGCLNTALSQTDLIGITATASGQIYLAGNCQGTARSRHGFILHKVGGNWVLAAQARANATLSAITSTTDGRVWASGSEFVQAQGIVAERGFTLTSCVGPWTTEYWPVVQHTFDKFFGISQTPQGMVIVGTRIIPTGEQLPIILTRSGNTWLPNPVAQPIPIQPSIDAIASNGDNTWAVGSVSDNTGTHPLTIRPRS